LYVRCEGGHTPAVRQPGRPVATAGHEAGRRLSVDVLLLGAGRTGRFLLMVRSLALLGTIHVLTSLHGFVAVPHLCPMHLHLAASSKTDWGNFPKGDTKFIPIYLSILCLLRSCCV
jgi:hypothetical protein